MALATVSETIVPLLVRPAVDHCAECGDDLAELEERAYCRECGADLCWSCDAELSWARRNPAGPSLCGWCSPTPEAA